MEMTKNYIADHLSVLMVKKDFKQNVEEELKVFTDLAEDIDDFYIGRLYEINRLMYPIHDILVDKENPIDDKYFRFLTEQLLMLNGRRVEIRSMIAKLYDEFTEYKTYA